MQETRVWSVGLGGLLEKGMATHSSILACKIPWTEEPGRLQFMGSQRLRHNWAAKNNKEFLNLFHIQSFLSPFLLLLSTLILICWHSLNTTHCDVLCLFVFVVTLMFLDVPPVVAYFIIFSVAFITLFLFLSLLLECELLQHLEGSEA